MKSATDTAVPLNSNCWQERRASDSTAYSHVTLQFHHSPTFNLFTDVSHSTRLQSVVGLNLRLVASGVQAGGKSILEADRQPMPPVVNVQHYTCLIAKLLS